VSNTHRLVQEKNLNWQQQNGISIAHPILVKVPKLQEPPFEGKIQDQKFKAILRKIIEICTSRAMPLHALPIAYFAALYQSLEPSLPFGQFQRFCITQGWIHQNLSKNMISIKEILK
jgi:hypothetical protein